MIRLNTLIKARYVHTETIEEVLQIEKIEELVRESVIEVWTPSAWQRVLEFVKFEPEPEYMVQLKNGYLLNCSGSTFVKTHFGWMKVSEIFELNNRNKFIHVKSTKGFITSTVHKTGSNIDLVNLRFNGDMSYWANGFEISGLSN